MRSYDDVVLSLLAYEFSDADRISIEAKIKRHLRDKALGAYDASKVELLRQLKNAVQQELRQESKSPYYTYPHGKPAPSGEKYVHHDDFDRARFVADLSLRFASVPKDAIALFVDFAVLIYYLK